MDSIGRLFGLGSGPLLSETFIQGLYKKGVQKINFIPTQAKTIQHSNVCR